MFVTVYTSSELAFDSLCGDYPVGRRQAKPPRRFKRLTVCAEITQLKEDRQKSPGDSSIWQFDGLCGDYPAGGRRAEGPRQFERLTVWQFVQRLPSWKKTGKNPPAIQAAWVFRQWVVAHSACWLCSICSVAFVYVKYLVLVCVCVPAQCAEFYSPVPDGSLAWTFWRAHSLDWLFVWEKLEMGVTSVYF